MNKLFISIIISVLLLCGCRSSIVDDPTLSIEYMVYQTSHVKLEIENSYNTVVATPIDRYQQAGQYSVSFDASGWMEGIYFYTLECKEPSTGYYYKSEKMMLLIK